MSLELTRRDVGRTSFIFVRGKLDVTRCRRLASAVDEALANAPRLLVIDICEVELADATALAVLVHARACALRQGTELKLVCDTPTTLNVLALTRLDRAFDISPADDPALKGGGAVG